MKKILVVDDEPMIVMTLSIRLKAAGYEVVTAQDGEEALTQAYAEKPDLVLLDVMMPKKNGFEVCRILKEDESMKHVPVVICTAKGSDADKMEGVMARADAYIIKPFDVANLMETVTQCLGN